jgi:hypothetical protein
MAAAAAGGYTADGAATGRLKGARNSAPIYRSKRRKMRITLM